MAIWITRRSILQAPLVQVTTIQVATLVQKLGIMFGAAGAPISDLGHTVPDYQALQDNLGLENIWYPFRSQCDWDFARWAKNRGPSSTAITKLLVIEGVVENLGLSFCNVRELNHLIDEELPGRPRFKCEEISLGGESFDIHFREVIPCIRALFGDPNFASRLNLAPERHYLDEDCTVQIFSEMHTGNWWWSVQNLLESHKPGATVIPVIISSDKTQLTLFRSKSTYPVYLSIGNILKDLHRKTSQHAQMLLGYILMTKLEHIGNKAAQRRALANLFHACMHKILAPIESYGKTGIAMVTGDRIWHQCHPILATFVGDYPEQLLICMVPRDELKSNATIFPLCDFKTATSVFALSDGNPTTFHAACRTASLKPTYHPFWQHLPFTDIFLSITPDILHQIHQGIAKHLIGCCSNQTARLNRAIRALLDFIYLSQYPVHTLQSLNALDTVLCRFHKSKDVFTELQALKHDFNLPKLHRLVHYSKSISLFGTADNYNTEQSERLHIDTKKAFQATNFKNKFEQMTTWLQRREAMDQHTAFIEWCKDRSRQLPQPPSAYPCPGLILSPILTIHPLEKGITFEGLSNRYGAIDFQDALADFIVQHNHPELSAGAARRRADNTLIPFRQVSIFHKIKFTSPSLDVGTIDALHIRPSTCNWRSTIPGRFDTAFVKVGTRFRVVQIWVVFQLPPSAAHLIFLSSRPAPPTSLVYVEWFSPLSPPPVDSHGMYQVSKSHRNGRRLASILPLSDVCRSIQLFPTFGQVAPRNWQSPTVLEECHTFYVNPFLDRHLYYNLDLIKDNL
ncbi:hypothetical protein V8E53_002245 [Lactarius tabidus]